MNGVAPGPIGTPLIPSTFPPDKVEEFGTDTPLGRVGRPDEVASCSLFLASDDSSYMTGQVLHPNGGRVVNGQPSAGPLNREGDSLKPGDPPQPE